MSGQNFSAGLRPAVCFGAQKSCFGGSKWCSSGFEGFETIFRQFLAFSGCFSRISPERMRFGGVTGPRGHRAGAAPRRLNVGNMLDVDRSPKCCFNMFNILRRSVSRIIPSYDRVHRCLCGHFAVEFAVEKSCCRGPLQRLYSTHSLSHGLVFSTASTAL